MEARLESAGVSLLLWSMLIILCSGFRGIVQNSKQVSAPAQSVHPLNHHKEEQLQSACRMPLAFLVES